MKTKERLLRYAATYWAEAVADPLADTLEEGKSKTLGDTLCRPRHGSIRWLTL